MQFRKQRHAAQAWLGNGCSLAALILGAQIFAPTLAQAQESEGGNEVVVTGSRIRTGFQTPTPVTVATAESLKATAPTNLADGLNQLPVFNGSQKTTQGGGGSAGGGSVGQNLLNLRGLGANRNLILLDGRRLVSTNQTGSVDVNLMPQNLIARVDVVTGGASAAYGSDAVAGVVNFALETKFEGIKGEIQGGLSSRNDLGEAQGSVGFGRAFADGRGHAIFSLQYAQQDGKTAVDDTKRDWYNKVVGQISNPVAGQAPGILVIDDIRAATGSLGGLITSGPLRGTQFLPGGVPAPFTYGVPTGTTFMAGGDGPRPVTGFSPDQKRANGFAHIEYDINDNMTLFAEGMYAWSHTLNGGSINQHVGTSAQFMIFRDNAYLPAATRNLMIANNLQSINIGRYFGDTKLNVNDGESTMKRGAVGLKGQLTDRWNYDVSYTYGQTDQSLFQRNRTNMRNIYAAVDAVVNPANGQIVCRSTLSGFDPGCVPMNIFGDGSVTAAAAAWSNGDTGKNMTLKQNVAQFNVAGDLGDAFQLGAGPISVATGFEYRKETASQTSDALSQAVLNFNGLRGFPTALNNRIGVWQSYNPQPLNGAYDIKEGYVELGVPVFKDLAFAQSMDVNGAVRYAEYSNAGGVTTWKYGANWLVIDDIRLRYTRSRDIRGPNTLELYNAQSQATQNVIYNGVTTQNSIITSGNPNLAPEVADTETYGIVLRPAFIPGLQASVDRYTIAIAGAIGTLGGQATVDLCAQGVQLACNQITVTSAGTLIIRQQTLNLNQAKNGGYDFEVSYARPAWGGELQLRALANHQFTDYTQALGAGLAVRNLGTPGSPYWRGTLSARYNRDRWSAFLQGRYISHALVDTAQIQGVTTSDNNIPAVQYVDFGAQYRFDAMGQEQELFLSINNLLDRQPPRGTGGNPTSFQVAADQAYDWVGRYFTAGLRFKF